jgi:hypothetical protein
MNEPVGRAGSGPQVTLATCYPVRYPDLRTIPGSAGGDRAKGLKRPMDFGGCTRTRTLDPLIKSQRHCNIWP